MPRRRASTDSAPFDTLRLEGSIFVPELLERAARGEATAQKEADYAVPKGLKLHDEYGRAYRIANALWQDFAPQLPRTDLDTAKLTHAFVFDLLRQCLGYTDLTLLSSSIYPPSSSDRGFPITAHAFGGRLPVVIASHTLGLDDPDPRFAVVGAGARRKSAHQLAQEFLNASRDCLWAIVTNGKSLRLLRDAETLTRPNFLEFDLETILREGEDRYADFSALWRILHASRSDGFQPSSDTCIWEKWKTEGHAQGLRVREGLRAGVQEALLILGTGFIAHRENEALRLRLHDGTLSKEEYFQQLLRLIYRCLFLFCAEERDLLHTPDSELSVRKTYAEGYSLRRLRQRSLRQKALDAHGDLWQAQTIVFRALATGQPRLALPALGGLFAENQCPDLDTAALANRDLLAAMRHLRWSSASGSLTAIDYRNMGPEELGSVYESLLELIPTVDLAARAFGFAGITDGGSTSGNERKTSGSYYTPDSLVQELIKSALEPVIADRLAAQPGRPVEALLSITVCDPSCGSGHFLLAAARRLAEKLAELRAPDGAVGPDDYRHALREVASRCLYGVDINPMAVELCRVALWLETVDPGKPLGFLNHHIRTGNSLLGTTPDLIAAGLPDDTFTAIEGDDKTACAELKKRNKKEREGFGPLFEKEEQTIRDRLRLAATQIEAMDDSQPAALQQKEAAFTTSETAPEYRHAKLLADLWCAAFVIKKHYPATEGEASSAPSPISDLPSPIEGHLLHTQDELFGHPTPAPAPAKTKAKSAKAQSFDIRHSAFGITTAHLRNFVQGQALPEALEKEVTQLASQYRFFHWHLAFPQVFDQGGFACILGNPPWDSLVFREEEFFANKRPEIVMASTASTRKRLIARLAGEDPDLFSSYTAGLREINATSSFVRSGVRYPLCGVGRVNLYALFAEVALSIVAPQGRVGQILPSGIVSDDSTKLFFQAISESGKLVSFFDFENREAIFPSVHRSYKFGVITFTGIGSQEREAEFVFFATRLDHISDSERRFRLAAREIALLNPETKTCPIFRSAKDAELAKHVYRRFTVIGVSDWQANLRRLLNSADDSGEFKNTPDADSSPLYEGKYFHHYDHRWLTNDGDVDRPLADAEKQDPDVSIKPRFWFSTTEVKRRFGTTWKQDWVLAWRDVTNATNERSFIASVLPSLAVPHTAMVIFFNKTTLEKAPAFIANIGSFPFDFIARQKIGGMHMSAFIVAQLPIVRATASNQNCVWAKSSSLLNWLLPRVLELTYTAWDLEAFAADCGWSGPPFRWDEERRYLLRCELDAAFFHLYLGPQSEWQQQPEALTRAFPTPRHAVSYIMDTFPIVKRKDETKHGHYRTQATILQIYDALGEAIQTGTLYQTLLNPPPADPACCHPPRQ